MSGQPSTPFASRDLLFCDAETSGLNPKLHEILDFAAVRMSPDLQTERGRLVAKCAMQWPERAEAQALEVNRYSAREWRDAQPVRVFLVDFPRMLEGEVFWVGHNPEFDVSFVREAYEREGLAMPVTKYKIDTASMAWPLVVAGHLQRVSLESLCTRYSIPNDGQHRALADVLRTVRVYAKLLGLKEPRFRSTFGSPAPLDWDAL